MHTHLPSLQGVQTSYHVGLLNLLDARMHHLLKLSCHYLCMILKPIRSSFDVWALISDKDIYLLLLLHL